MATQLLRPLAFGEILDGSFSIYRRIFGTLVAIAIVCQGIPSILGVYVQISGGPTVQLGLWGVTWVASIIGGILAAGATLYAISEAYLGREPEFGPAISYALSKAINLLIAGIFKYFLAMVGFLFFIIPGLIVLMGLAVVSQVVVLESVSPGDAVRRSWTLTKGFRFRVLGLYLIMGLIVNIPSYIAGFLGAVFTTSAPTVLFVSVAIGTVFTLILYPLVACALTLYYYDLRVRKEAFDLQLLSQQLEMAGG